MKTFNENKLLELEACYANFLQKLQLPVNDNRFFEAFRNYRNLSAEMKVLGVQTVPEKWNADFRHAVYDLTELLDIYNAIKDYENSEFIKGKIKILNEGVISPAHETSRNNSARNIQFELKLFSELNEAGIKCKFGSLNPDIEVFNSVNERICAIECKRIFSNRDSSIEENISSAREQLNALLAKNPDLTGIIAIDITRRITGGTDYLRAKSETVALSRLSHDMDKFRVKYLRHFSPNKITNKRILAVLIHSSVYTYIEDREMACHGAFTVIHEIHPEPFSKILFKKVYNDIIEPLSKHKNSLNTSNIYV